MTDPMDERLRLAAERWRADQPAPGPVDLDQSGAARHRRRWSVVAPLAAAAAVAALVVIVSVNRHDGRTTDPAPTSPHSGSPTPEPSAAVGVPWKRIPPTRPHVRVPTRPGYHAPDVPPYSTPFDDLAVTGDLDVHGAPGDTVDFVVSLSAATRTPLDPCPDYSMWVGAQPAQRFALNCADVPYLDRHGVPYLPAGTPVDFRMRLTVPDLVGRQKLLWGIDGPFSIPGTNGVLTIEP